jgi:hypothetical protein
MSNGVKIAAIAGATAVTVTAVIVGGDVTLGLVAIVLMWVLT